MKLFLTMLAVLMTSAAYAQNLTVTGVVTDSNNGDPVPFAAVHVKGTMTGTSTDAEGNYSITAPQDGVLVFSCVGYQNLQVAVDGKLTHNVVLVSEQLEEVVMVAYGTAKKSSFTGSATSVKSESLEKRTVSNVTKALDGLVPGVTTSAGSGQPGESASIQIRGYGSINASSTPLYVVDGVPYDGSIAAINPNDIESLTVLKDASAAALYGSRGANGVVMIQTKKGQEGFVNVNLKATWGLSSRAYKPYDTVNQREFVELTYEALRNGYMFNNGYSMDHASQAAMGALSSSLGGEQYNPFKNYTWDTVIDPATGKVRADAVSAYDESWLNEMTNPKALRSEYLFGVNGGTDKTKYALSFGYLDDNGILITTNFKRYTFRASVDHEITDWMKAGVSTSYGYTTSNQQTIASGTYTSNAWYTAQFMAPIYPVYLKDEAGNTVMDANGKALYDYGELGRPKAARFNNIADLYDNKYGLWRDNTSSRANIVLGGDNDVMGVFKGLEFSVNAGFDVTNSASSEYQNPYHGDGAQTGGSVAKQNGRTMSYTINEILKYDRTFADKHHVLAQAGHEFYNYEYRYLAADRTGVYPGIDELYYKCNRQQFLQKRLPYRVLLRTSFIRFR